MRWNKKFDGSKDSLANESKTPKSIHPNAHVNDRIEQSIKTV